MSGWGITIRRRRTHTVLSLSMLCSKRVYFVCWLWIIAARARLALPIARYDLQSERAACVYIRACTAAANLPLWQMLNRRDAHAFIAELCFAFACVYRTNVVAGGHVIWRFFVRRVVQSWAAFSPCAELHFTMRKINVKLSTRILHRCVTGG